MIMFMITIAWPVFVLVNDEYILCPKKVVLFNFNHDGVSN